MKKSELFIDQSKYTTPLHGKWLLTIDFFDNSKNDFVNDEWITEGQLSQLHKDLKLVINQFGIPKAGEVIWNINGGWETIKEVVYVLDHTTYRSPTVLIVFNVN